LFAACSENFWKNAKAQKRQKELSSFSTHFNGGLSRFFLTKKSHGSKVRAGPQMMAAEPIVDG